MAYKRKNRRLTEALTAYQEALASHATTVAEEQAIAKAAVNDLKLDAIVDADTKLFDIKEVTEQVEAKIEELEANVYSAGAGVINEDAGINAETIALANELLAGFEKVAQNKVDALKVKNAAAVNLQEKVKAYDSAVKDMNDVTVDYKGAVEKFTLSNDSVNYTDVKVSKPGSKDDFKVTVALSEDASVTLSFDKNGELVVTGSSLSAEVIAGLEADLAAANASNEVVKGVAEIDATNIEELKTAIVEIQGTDTDAPLLSNLQAALDAVDYSAADGALTSAKAAATDAATAAGGVNDGFTGLNEVSDLNDGNAGNLLTALGTPEEAAQPALFALHAALTSLGEDYSDLDSITSDMFDAAKAEAEQQFEEATELNDAIKDLSPITDADTYKAALDAVNGLGELGEEHPLAALKTALDGVYDAANTELATTKEAIAQAINAANEQLAVSTSEGAVEAYEELSGTEAFEAAVEALYGNIATQAAAAAAVDAAMLNALKKEGYKVYEDGAAADAKAVSWTNVEIKNGKLVSTVDGKEFNLQILKDGAFLGTLAATEAGTELVSLPGINPGTPGAGSQLGVEPIFEKGSIVSPASIKNAADNSEGAVKDLQKAKDDIKDFNKAVDAYNAAVETEKALEDAAADVKAAAEAVAEAEGAFEELGFNLVKAVDGVADGTAFDENAEDQAADLFVYGESKLTVENFDGQDVLYFGDKAADLITITKAQAESAAGKVGGEANVLDIFAYQDGANTILLVEKEAFAGNASGAATDNPDLAEVTLTGVNVADLSFEDGFLAFA